MTDSK